MVEAALDAEFEGHEAVNCVAADNALGRPLVDLFADHYGTVPDPATVEGDDSAYDVGKAERILGWSPRFSWREAADADVETPIV